MSESEATAAEAVEEQAAEETPRLRPRSPRRPPRSRRRRTSARPTPRRTSTSQNDPDIKAAEEELLEEAIPVPVGPAAGRQAKVYLCERGHRTVAIWSDPTTCQAARRAAPSAAARSTRSASCPSRSRRR